MYIYDCLYGEIDFEKKVYLCILTPEMQRLREVRLGNVNSLFLTGCASINRFEHSVGTAYLAKVNAQMNPSLFNKIEKQNFVLAALFHDLANGPFGHSYEYILEKQGFIPENSIGAVINCDSNGSHKKVASLEPIYFGQMNGIKNILNKNDIVSIDEIVCGKNVKISKLISDKIDIDNIDNVFRMAYHMGIKFSHQAPLQLAKGIFCKNNKIFFKNETLPYLHEWYIARGNIYKMLLYNPQDFAAKCMLAEALDSVLEKNPEKIKWYFTDNELIHAIRKNGEIWIDYDQKLQFIKNPNFSFKTIEKKLMDENTVKKVLKDYYGIEVSDNAIVSRKKFDEYIEIKYYNTVYRYKNKNLYKHTRICIKAPQIVQRLMCGDLYQCIALYKSRDISCYSLFSDFSKRLKIEHECNSYIEHFLNEKGYFIAFHAIVDKEKTNRQLDISLESGEELIIGKSTNEILIGAFIKNPCYGIAKGKLLNNRKRQVISDCIKEFLQKYGIKDAEQSILYNEVKTIET